MKLEADQKKKQLFKAMAKKYNFESDYKNKVRRSLGKMRCVRKFLKIKEKKQKERDIEKEKEKEREKNDISLLLIKENELIQKTNNKYDEIEMKKYFNEKQLMEDIKNDKNIPINEKHRLDDENEVDLNKRNYNEKNTEIKPFFYNLIKSNENKANQKNEDEDKDKKISNIIKRPKKKVAHHRKLDIENIVIQPFNFKGPDISERSLNNLDTSNLKLFPKNNFQVEIEHVVEINFDSTLTRQEKKYSKIFDHKKRIFNFYIKNRTVSCFKISITNPQPINDLAQVIKSYMKTGLITFLYLFLWFYLAIFIQSIYKQYGKNIFKICVMPLISMLVIKLCITVNIIMFFTTVVLYYFGDYFSNRKKYALFPLIIFKALVPPLAFQHYEALKFYVQFMKNY